MHHEYRIVHYEHEKKPELEQEEKQHKELQHSNRLRQFIVLEEL